jgi:hypothetical protein
MWSRLVLIALAAIVVIALAVAWQAQRRWQATTDELNRSLTVGVRPTKVALYSEQELEGLPPPVARFFRLVLREGRPMIRHARVTWTGEFNMGEPGADNWKPFAAVQNYVVDSPGFVWDARIAMAPGVPVLVRDAFIAGEGSMRGKIAGIVTVVESAGTPAIAAAALQRHLGEAIWFPTALLPSQGVKWEAIDDTRARATLTAGRVTVSREVRFGTDGLIDSVFVPDRLFDNGKDPPAPHPWRARNVRWGEMEGLKVPPEAVVEWMLPTGTYAYWRGRPTKIECETAAR